jgi:rhomboid protease GluP
LGFDVPAALGMKVNELIIHGQIWRLITPVLLHGSILHLGFNMYALYILGPGLERFYGHWRFLTLYLLAGFAGNVMSFIFSPNPSLGASTAIFGLLGAQGVFLYHNRGIYGRHIWLIGSSRGIPLPKPGHIRQTGSARLGKPAHDRGRQLADRSFSRHR